MPNPSWPVTLPDPLLEGFSEATGTMVLRSPAREGFPAKRRRIASQPVRTFNITLVLTETQRLAFDTFYKTTCEGGSIPFDWEDHFTGSALTYYFVQVGDYQPVAPDGPYRLNLILEALPS